MRSSVDLRDSAKICYRLNRIVKRRTSGMCLDGGWGGGSTGQVVRLKNWPASTTSTRVGKLQTKRVFLKCSVFSSIVVFL